MREMEIMLVRNTEHFVQHVSAQSPRSRYLMERTFCKELPDVRNLTLTFGLTPEGRQILRLH
jgi:hypothetical protein